MSSYYRRPPSQPIWSTWTRPPYQGAPPPIPQGINVNPQQWQAGYWQPNPHFNPQARQQQHVPWIPAQTWNQPQQQQVNPFKRVPRPPSAEYLATKLSDNPLGLENLDPSKSLYNDVQEEDPNPTTPWIWNPQPLDDDPDDGPASAPPSTNPSALPIPPPNAIRHQSEPELFTSKRQLQPTFSTNIVRTPGHYTPSRNSSRNSARSSIDTLSSSMQSLSTTPNPLTRHYSMPATNSSPTSADSLLGVSHLSDEPSSILSPLMIANTPKPVSNTRALAAAALASNTSTAQPLTRHSTLPNALSTIPEGPSPPSSSTPPSIPRTSSYPSTHSPHSSTPVSRHHSYDSPSRSSSRPNSRHASPTRQSSGPAHSSPSDWAQPHTPPAPQKIGSYPPPTNARSPPYHTASYPPPSTTNPRSPPPHSATYPSAYPPPPASAPASSFPVASPPPPSSTPVHRPASTSGPFPYPFQQYPPPPASAPTNTYFPPYPNPYTFPVTPTRPPHSHSHSQSGGGGSGAGTGNGSGGGPGYPYYQTPPSSASATNTSGYFPPNSASAATTTPSRRNSSSDWVTVNVGGGERSADRRASVGGAQGPRNNPLPPPPAILPYPNLAPLPPKQGPPASASSYPTPPTPSPPSSPPSSNHSPPSSSTPPPPASSSASASASAPKPTTTNPHRIGFYNRRGDHLTLTGYIVYAPLSLSFPPDLSTYPPEDEGYQDEMGTFTEWVPRPELPESLPRHGRSPERPYESFIRWG